jgi:hypothetical protein
VLFIRCVIEGGGREYVGLSVRGGSKCYQEQIQMQSPSYSVVVTKLSASVVTAIRLTSHVIKNEWLAGWAPKARVA